MDYFTRSEMSLFHNKYFNEFSYIIDFLSLMMLWVMVLLKQSSEV